MSVKEVTMYRVECDGCGKGNDANSTFFAWADEEAALFEAAESEWLVNDDGQWCPDCYIWTDEKDSYVPISAPPGPLSDTGKVGA